jgi:hypothetical protein
LTTKHARRCENPEFGHEVVNGHSHLIWGHHFLLASTQHVVAQLLLGQEQLESSILFSRFFSLATSSSLVAAYWVCQRC